MIIICVALLFVLRCQVLESEELLKAANQDLKRCLDDLKASNGSLTHDYNDLCTKVLRLQWTMSCVPFHCILSLSLSSHCFKWISTSMSARRDLWLRFALTYGYSGFIQQCYFQTLRMKNSFT